MTSTHPTVLLVHGTFDDGSSWREVIAELQTDGVPVRALAPPLRSLYADAGYVARAAAEIDGPILLVGHSYGGMVITEGAVAAGNVIGLVYVAAFIPELGESVSSINAHYPARAGAPALEAASSGPVACFEQPATRTAWRELPSWALIATDDHVVHPDSQFDMAARAGAAATSVAAAHAVALVQPGAVADVIRRALPVTVPAMTAGSSR